MRQRGRATTFLVVVALALARLSGQHVASIREIVWDDLAPPLQKLLGERGLDRATFAGYLADARRRTQARVREGDLDHVVYYALQGTAFTTLPPIEPAVSAKAFVDRLSPGDRSRFLAGDDVPGAAVSRAVKARFEAFDAALKHGARDARLTYFREVVTREHTEGGSSGTFLLAQYVRAMRFLYEKEFVAPQAAGEATAIGSLYQRRGLSTDTSVEAGYAVYLALATLRQLEPRRRIRRALVVGPGLDVAPRSGLTETGAPQSYQPLAVVDALLALGLADRETLRMQVGDVNPRVTGWFARVHGMPLRLMLVSSVAQTDRVRVTDDYRTYFTALGRTIGHAQPLPGRFPGRLAKSLDVSSAMTGVIEPATLDIVVDRFTDRYDLAIVTNVFPYLSDPDLLLAFTNIASMLAPGGILIHNEARPLLADVSLALHLPLIHARTVVIATVKDGRAPLYDAIWMHRAPE